MDLCLPPLIVCIARVTAVQNPPMIDKTVSSVAAAIADVADGATVMIGGFGTAGMPAELIDALIAQGARDLTIVNNNAGNADGGLALLLKAKRVRKIICSFPRQTDSWHFDALYRAGEIELELVPQGNLAERIRAAGAGIGAFFTPTGYGTLLAEDKETRLIQGRHYVLEYPDPRRLCADQGGARRSLGESGLPQDGAQLRPHHGDSGPMHGGPGARDHAARLARPRAHRHARNIRAPVGGNRGVVGCAFQPRGGGMSAARPFWGVGDETLHSRRDG